MKTHLENCELCRRDDALLIHEFPGSRLFLGDHQYFQGYCVLVSRNHVRELHEMPEDELSGLMLELAQASKAIQAAFDPWKMNHASLGNLVPHLHWHIFPRYENEDDRFQNPWYRMDEFKNRVPDAATQKKLIEKIRKHLS